MADAPISYRDPVYASLDERITSKLGLPDGLLSSIRTRGEKSNADQVSEAGAKSVYQIIPATRDAVLKKYGIDAYLSADNAAEAAGLLLKESLDRNKGNVKLAAAEYHGGTDRANWGPRTSAYVSRVSGGVARATPPAAADAPARPQSTFDRVSAQAAPAGVDASALRTSITAYQQGRMSPEDAKAFEGLVQSGGLVLPAGVSLQSNGPAAAPEVPAAVLQAYRSGKMSPEDAGEFKRYLDQGAFKLPAGQTLAPEDAIPTGYDGAIPAATNPQQATPADPSLVQQAMGLGEAGLALASGATTGMVGGALGAGAALLNGQPGQVFPAMQKGAEALTYSPKTPLGQAYTQDAAALANETLPLAGLAPQMALAGAAARSAVQPAATVARAAVPAAQQAARAVPQAVSRAAGAVADTVMPGRAAERAPTAGTGASIGAAGTDLATQRRETAANLPVPMRLSEGQATRDFEAQRFETETAKDPSLGGPLRDFAADQNARVQRNFEALIDESGAQAPNLIETGRAVDKALRSDAARKKVEYKVKYREAEKAGQMEDPVSTAPLVDYIRENESFDAPGLAPSLALARKELVRLGGAVEVDGVLQPRDLSLKQTELLRRQINTAIGSDPGNKTNQSIGIGMKEVIDGATEGLGGDLYKQARKARQRYAQLFENNAIVSNLLKTKRGTADRQVALEDVFGKTILNGSREDLSNLRRTLQVSESQEGAQAWKELQGATVRHIIEEATKGVGTDTRGNPIVSAAKMNNAIRGLDQDGKLDFVLSKKGAQTVRDLNEVTKYVYTQPPGTVNHSNTASVILAALAESGALGATAGLPVPIITGLKVISSQIKDAKVRRRINEVIGRQPSPAPKPRTLH